MTPLVKMAHDLPDDYERRAICNYTISTITGSGINDSYLAELIESFGKVKNDLDIIINREYASPFTDDIKRTNAERIKYIKDIERGLAFFSNHFDSGKVKSSNKILVIFNDCFKDIPDRKHETYTQVIDTFLSRVKDAALIPAWENLEMMELVDLLGNSQTSFLSFKSKRAHEETAEHNPLCLDVREEMHNLYDLLQGHLNFKQLKGSAEHEELTQNLNGSITEILAGAKSRKTHKSNEEAEEEIMDDVLPEEDQAEEWDDIPDEM